MARKRKQAEPGKQVNQYTFDIRQDKAFAYYIDPKSETYGNATKSALKAGYEFVTADKITVTDWWIGKCRRLTLLSKAEKVLEDTITMNTDLPVIGMFGPIIDKETKKAVTKEDANLLKIKQDSAKFVAERLGKKHYSTRTELTGADGSELPTPIYSSKSVKK